MGFLKVLQTIQTVGNAASTLQEFAKADKWGKIDIGTNVANQALTKHQDAIVKYVKNRRSK